MANTEHTSREQDFDQAARVSEEYEAGYQARFEGIAECTAATMCWRQGWQEADQEMAISALGKASNQAAVTSTPFGTGHDARACDVPFDDTRSESWKRSWVEADIAMGLTVWLRSA